MKSQGHYEKVKEEALCNRLFGKSQMFRRLNSHGCRLKSKRSMRTYWGAKLENLGHLARQLVYEESRVIFYKWGKSSSAKTHAITNFQGVYFFVCFFESSSPQSSSRCLGLIFQLSQKLDVSPAFWNPPPF